ncbi:MAG: hypothetical protein KDD47_08395 [Acidobacteria bacterium]|nr:hypothetical protein [Acidobacteriota bacterium]
MEYPGNSALPADIKERIISTFRQTVESARQGKGNEALLGCDFILKLDPDFKPARDLTRKLQAAAAPKTDAKAEIEALVRARRFKEALELGKSNSALVASDPSLAGFLSHAQELAEASPYVSSFLDSAETAFREGDAPKASALLEKARSLDPEHPRLQKLEASLESLSPAAPEEPSASSSSAFSLDFDEPVTSFRLDGSAPAAEADPFGAITNEPAESVGGFDGLEDDPLASLGEDPLSALAEAEPEAAPSLPNPPDFSDLSDPFANLETADPLAAEFRDDESPGAEELSLEDDPLAFGPLPSSDDDAELGDEDVEKDPFDLLTLDEDASLGGAALLDQPVAGEGSGDRVRDLLDDGQAAFDRGDHQGAIDAWSRIFLIDIDNEEASRRIEKARKLKAESERAVEEVYHAGLDAWESGDTARAQESFERVLETQPGHAAARENLDQLLAGEASPGIAVAEMPDLADTLGSVAPSRDDLLEEILIPPAPGESTPASVGGASLPVEPAAKVGRAKGGRSPFLVIGLGVLVLVLVGAWWIFNNRSSFFPNARSESAAGQESSRPDPIQRAEKLHAAGETEQAIAQLKRVLPTSPHHQKAQELIAEWSAPPAEAEPALAPELVARRQALGDRAAAQAEAGEFLRVRDTLEMMARIAPLDPEEESLFASAREHLQPLEGALQQMEDREWTLALQELWRLQLKDPKNADVIRLIVDSYYNLGVRELQRGNQQAAVEHFQEAVKLKQDDQEIARHMAFAQTYLERPEDLLYRIYVKYLPYRTK